MTKVIGAPPPEQPTPPTAAEELDQALAHAWIVAAEIKVEERVAKLADFRGSFTTVAGTRVDALEVYCRNCRRPYEDVAEDDCEALIDNRHLIGGDQTQRAKRKIPQPPSNARIVPGGVIQRRGIGAYVSGVSRPAR
ncbi:hypothetical protein GCM10019016_080870 [Streptomyces prasinosporus]|uniref:Uncharacterized protein n=2 Tax=Streptomyces TaxID=1883 RepID=A0ABP6U051_9ACTN|nr:hypothetical protein [Streptomyces tricolor]MCG0062090.1 hypothetical protein [Streptomyces tricolor]GHC14615.1 hypothetical protein GCM10010332_51090 [Streptomyces albogriseolus]